MGGRVDAVGGNFIFDDSLVLQLKVFLGGSADDGILRQHHDAGVAGADAQLVLGTDHAEALHAADLGLLDLEVSGKDGAQLGEEHFLSGRHVGGAAHHLDGLGGAVVYGGHVQVVAVRMGLAGEHLGHHHALQTAGNDFLHLNAVYLNADGGHGLGHLIRGEVCLQILLKPIVT